MIDIARVHIGQVLMTDEYLAGEYRVLCGPVVLIDHKSNLVVIDADGERRSFLPSRFYTPNAFMSRKIGPPQSSFPNRGTRVLAGFIATLKAGRVKESDLQTICQEIQNKGIPTARPDDALEVVKNL